MFTPIKKIIYITKTDIEGITVSLGRKPKIKDRYQVAWNAQNLPEVLGSVASKLSTDKVLLLLGQDLAYVLELSLPEGVKEDSKRETIYTILQGEVPEVFSRDQWDYRETGDVQSGTKVIAFVPVISTFQQVSDAFHAIGCTVIATEPEQISKLRNPDPILGIAQKQDISGKDQDSLSLKLFNAVVEKPSPSAPSSENKSGFEAPKARPKVRKKYLITLFVVGVAGALTIIGILSSRSLRPKKQRAPVIVSTPTVSPSPPADLISPKDYSVQVLNGSGVAGEADYVAGFFKEEGFSEITTDNADSYNYTNTVIRIKESSLSAELTDLVTNILSEYTIESSDYLPKDANYDLLIIVGQKNEE